MKIALLSESRAGVTQRGIYPQLITDLVLALSYIGGVIVILLRDRLLPARFFYDGLHIQQIAQLERSSAIDSSYGVVGLSYRFVGLQNLPLLTGLISFSIFFLIVMSVRRQVSIQKLGPTGLLMIAVTLFLGAVYLGYYSKDVFVLPLVMLALASRKHWSLDILLLVGMLSYATWFRSYWFLVAVAFVGLRWLATGPRAIQKIIVGSFFAAGIFGMLLSLILGIDPNHFRTTSNAGRQEGVDAGSMITPFFTGSGIWVGVLNVLSAWVSIVVPVPLALKGSFYYLALAMAIFAIWASIVKSFQITSFASEEPSAEQKRAMSLLFSFVAVQALFEPDYGSVLRHLTPLLPLVILLVLRAESIDRPMHANVARRALH